MSLLLPPLAALCLGSALLGKGDGADRDWQWTFGSRGLEVSPAKGVKFRLGARLQYDVNEFDPDLIDIPDEHGVRRLRVTLSGSVTDDWSFFVERDAAGATPGWEEVWLRYKGLDWTELTAGNQIAPFSLEEVQGSFSTLFIERALPNALVSGLYKGIAARSYGDDWSVSAGYFGNTLDAEPKKNSQGSGPVARATYAPLNRDGLLLHLGGSLEYRQIDADTVYRIRARPEAGLTHVRLIETPRILDVNDTWSYGLESASILGPVLFQGEYVKTRLERDTVNVGFWGCYAESSVLLTGEQRQYDARRGALKTLTPDSSWGAVEAAARWSKLDLSDGDIFGGVETDTALGLTWTLDTNVKLMANYIFVHAHPDRHDQGERPEVFELRLQVGF